MTLSMRLGCKGFVMQHAAQSQFEYVSMHKIDQMDYTYGYVA